MTGKVLAKTTCKKNRRKSCNAWQGVGPDDLQEKPPKYLATPGKVLARTTCKKNRRNILQRLARFWPGRLARKTAENSCKTWQGFGRDDLQEKPPKILAPGKILRDRMSTLS
jgi:predicted small secreted protein